MHQRDYVQAPETTRSPRGTISLALNAALYPHYTIGVIAPTRSISGKMTVVADKLQNTTKQEQRSESDSILQKCNPQRYEAEKSQLEALMTELDEAIKQQNINSGRPWEARKSGNKVISLGNQIENIYFNRSADPAYQIAKKAHTRNQERQGLQLVAPHLKEAGIVFEMRDDEERGSWIDIDPSQTGLNEKISTLMDRHKAAILERNQNVSYIIPKPDGTALDQEQAAKIIANRIKTVKVGSNEAQELYREAEDYGVTKIVEALISPRDGWARGKANPTNDA